MREFWQNFPLAMEAGDAAVTVRLFPRQSAAPHELQGGERKTHEIWLTFGPEALEPAADFQRVPAAGFRSAGLRWVPGTDEPAIIGKPNSRDWSYIHFASFQEYDRCLSLKTGTAFLLSRKTLTTCSKNFLRGYIVTPRSSSL